MCTRARSGKDACSSGAENIWGPGGRHMELRDGTGVTPLVRASTLAYVGDPSVLGSTLSVSLSLCIVGGEDDGVAVNKLVSRSLVHLGGPSVVDASFAGRVAVRSPAHHPWLLSVVWLREGSNHRTTHRPASRVLLMGLGGEVEVEGGASSRKAERGRANHYLCACFMYISARYFSKAFHDILSLMRARVLAAAIGIHRLPLPLPLPLGCCTSKPSNQGHSPFPVSQLKHPQPTIKVAAPAQLVSAIHTQSPSDPDPPPLV